MTQQTLREKIQKVCDDYTVESVGGQFVSEEGIDAILQQVIEWVDKEIIGENETEFHSHPMIDEPIKYRNQFRALQRQNLQQLKEEV